MKSKNKVTFEVFDMQSKDCDKARLYGFMGDIFSCGLLNKELPYLSNSLKRVWILILADNKLAGFGSYEPKGNKYELKNDYIFPDFNKELFNQLFKKRLQMLGNAQMEATIEDELVPFYQKNGFKVICKKGKYNYVCKGGK